MRRSSGLIALVALVALAHPASAQITQGRLTGLVTDSQAAALPGVSVTVTSPALIGVQSTVSQPDGRFMFPALPTGPSLTPEGPPVRCPDLRRLSVPAEPAGPSARQNRGRALAGPPACGPL